MCFRPVRKKILFGSSGNRSIPERVIPSAPDDGCGFGFAERRTPLLEQLKCLIDYQVLEDKKTLLLRGYEETPKRIAELEQGLAKCEEEYLARQAEFEHAGERRRSLEQVVAELQARIERSRNRMKEVKTNKEYQAIQKEVDEAKKEIAGREEEMLAALESAETLSAEVERLKAEVEERRRKLEENKRVLKTENAALQQKLDRLEALAEKVRERTERDLLRRYEFILRKQAGIGVAAVVTGVCQVCHMNIPPQKFIELQRDEHIMQCPHCHRFLYWPGHEGYCVVNEDLSDI